MSEELRWTLSVQAVSGPAIAANGSVIVDVYEKSNVVIPARDSGTDGTLDISIDTTGAELLVVSADQYVDAAAPVNRLGYTINPAPAPEDAGPSGDLIAPLMLIGNDVISLLANPVTLIHFTNPIETDITVNIIVGGDATP